MLARAFIPVIAACLVAAAAGAEAGALQVSPTRLDLAARGSSGIISLTNTGAEPVRLALSAFAWERSLDGQPVTTETRELIVFPTLFSLAPKETRRIKVGVTAAPGAREHSYRLIVEELPPPPSTTGASGVRVLTRMSIPIFQAPAKASVAGAISAVSLGEARLSLDVENRGTVHVVLQAVEVAGLDDHGLVVWRGKAPGWYLLAAEARTFALEVPTELAARLVSLQLEAITDQGTWSAVVAVARKRALRP